MKRMRLLKTRCLSLLLLAATPLAASAAVVTIKTSDATGTSSFIGNTNWSDGNLPNLTNDYVVSGVSLRSPTPSTTNSIFLGNSLTLSNGATLLYKGTASSVFITVTNLIFNNATYQNAANSGSTFSFNGGINLVGPGIFTGNNGAMTNFATLSGNGPLTLINGGTIFLGNSTNYTGKILIGSGTVAGSLYTDSSARLGTNPATFTADQLTFTNGTFFNMASLALSDPNRGITVSASNGTFNVLDSTVLAVSSPIAGPGRLTKAGNGTLALSGANTLAGGLYLTAGQLNLNSATALGTVASSLVITSGVVSLDNTSGSTVTLANNNPQYWGTNFTFIGSTNLNLGSGAVTMNAARTVTVNSNVLTVGGAISGAYTLTKAGNGTLVLAGANGITNTTITAGTVIMNGTSALGNAGLTFSGTNNATLDLMTDGSDTAYVMNAGSSSIFTIASDVKTGSTGINHTLGAVSIGAGTAPALQMNIVRGTNVTAGSPTLTLGALTLSAGVGGTTIITPTTADVIIPSVTSVSGNKTLQLDGTSTASAITGVLGQGANVVSVLKTGTGTWALGGVNTYTGTTTVSNGTLVVSGIIGSNVVTVAGGSLVLSGSGSISNGTVVALASGTKLDISGTTGTAIGTGSTLSGSGSVVGSFTSSSGSIFYPGGVSTVGTLTFSNNLTLVGGETLNFDFSSTTNDQIVVAGNITPSGTTTINLASLPGGAYLPAGDYILIKAAGTLSGSAANFAISGAPSPSRQSFALVYSGNNVVLRVTGSNANLVWQGGLNGNLWDVTTTLNWLNSSTSALFYNGDIATFTAAGAANPPVLNATVYPSQVIFNSTADYALTGTGKISGSGSVTVSGSSTVTISTANDYTGATTLSGGKLSVASLANGGAASPIGAATSDSANLVFNGGTLQYTGATASSDHGATLAAGGGTISLGSSGYTLTLAGALVGTNGGGLTKTGNDTLVLSGANNYAGTTTIGAGVLQVGAGGTTGNVGTGPVVNNGALVVNTTGSVRITNVISGVGSISNLGTGTLVLGPTNTYTGQTMISTGIVQVLGAHSFGATPASFNASQVSLTGGGQIEAAASFSLNDTNTGITMDTGTITVDTNVTLTIANPVVATTALTKSSPGTLVLSGNNTLSGVLNVDTASATSSDGILRIASPNALGGVPTINIRNNQAAASSTLQLDATKGSVEINQTIAWSGRNNYVPAIENVSGSNVFNPSSVTFNAGGTSYMIQSDAGTLSIPASFPSTAPVASRNLILAGAGRIDFYGSIMASSCTNLGIIKTNYGTVTYWAGNSYTGMTTVEEGTLNVADNASFGNAGVNGNIEIAPYTNSVATLNISNVSVTAQRVIIAGISGNNTTPGTGTLNQYGGTIDSYQWFTVGSGGTVGGTGTYNLFGGTLNVHTQQMEIANFISSTGTVNQSDSTYINIWSNNPIAMGANAFAGDGTYNQNGGNLQFYSDQGGTLGGSGVLYLGRASGLTNTYTYRLNGGYLLAPTITSVSGTSLFYFNGGTLQAVKTNTAFFGGLTAAYVSTNTSTIDSSSYAVTFTQGLLHNPVLGSTKDGGFTIQGSGVVTFAGTNTYTGPTTLNSGVLAVNGVLSNSTVTVNGGTLSGTGVIAGPTVLNYGYITPGGSLAVGALTVSNALTLAGGTVLYDMTKYSNDVIKVSGAVNVTGSTTLQLTFPAPGVGVYTLFTYGSLSGFANLSLSLTTPNPRFSLVLTNDTSLKAVRVVVTGNSANLVWRGDGSYNGWDNTGSYNNWNANTEYFYDGDVVTFDNSGSNTPSISLTATVSPSSVTVNSTNSYDFAGYGTVTSTGGLIKQNTGSLILEVDNTYQTASIGGGTLQVGNGGSSGSLTVASGYLTNNGALAFNRSDAITFGSEIDGSGGVVQAGSGSVALTVSNSYTGPTVVSAGVLYPQNSYALGSGVGSTIATNGGQVYFNQNVDFPAESFVLGGSALRKGGAGTTTLGGAVTLVANTVLTLDGSATLNLTNTAGISGSGYNLQLAGAGTGNITGPTVLGTGGLTKTDAGTWTLGTNNNYTGLTTVSAGTLRVMDSSLGKPSVFTPNQITLAGGSLEAGTNVLFKDALAGITLGADSTIVVDTGSTLTFSNEITGGYSLTKTGVGTMVLATSNSFSGTLYVDTASTSANDGALRLASPLALSAIANVYQRNNNSGYSTLQLDASAGNLVLPQTFTVSCRNVTNINFENLSGSNTISGVVDIQSGGGAVYFQSDAGILNFAGGIQYVGTATGARVYTFSGAGTNLVSAPITAGINAAAPVGIAQTGTGTLLLTAANTYTNATTVSAGSLWVQGSILGGGGVTVSGGNLGGTGVISDAVSVQSAGTLSPGYGLGSIGTLTVNSNLTLNGTVSIDINKTAGTSDKVIGVSNLIYGGTLFVTNLSGTLTTNDSFAVFSAATYASNFTAIAGSPGTGLAWHFNPTNGVVSVVSGIPTNAIPINYTISGNTLTLNWAVDHTGWILQAQTNVLGKGLSTNWVDVAGSSSVNSKAITIYPTNPTVFYRLRTP